MHASARAPTIPAAPITRKFCSSGSLSETIRPISTGATMAPRRPIPEAMPTPVERIDMG
ncbi:hypothetical protein D3C72_1947180 [compost metagenome]